MLNHNNNGIIIRTKSSWIVVVTQGLDNTKIDLKVASTKKTFAEIIDMVNDIEVKSYLGNTLKGYGN